MDECNRGDNINKIGIEGQERRREMHDSKGTSSTISRRPTGKFVDHWRRPIGDISVRSSSSFDMCDDGRGG
jgi:hypothetical protein